MKSEVTTNDRAYSGNGSKNNETEKFQFRDSVKIELLQSKPKGKK